MDAEARLAIFAIVEQHHGVMNNGGWVESMCRLINVIPFVLVKDRTIVGTSIEIERMPLT